MLNQVLGSGNFGVKRGGDCSDSNEEPRPPLCRGSGRGSSYSVPGRRAGIFWHLLRGVGFLLASLPSDDPDPHAPAARATDMRGRPDLSKYSFSLLLYRDESSRRSIVGVAFEEEAF
jgi:hypothetical protein